MDTTIITNGISFIDFVFIILALVIVLIIVSLQIESFIKTKNRINKLATFFPSGKNLKRIESSITKPILDSTDRLARFLANPPARYIADESIENEVEEEYIDVDLISINNHDCSAYFQTVIDETNVYLCKNIGTSADFSIIQDISERKIEALETQISNTINAPLYLGLAGTFIGIIFGLIGIAINVEQLFLGNMSPLRNLLIGVVIAMIASLVGLSLMLYNSSIHYKKAFAKCERNKNGYYDFIRRELMPILSNSMTNEISKTFVILKDSSESLAVFRDYQKDLNKNIKAMGDTITKMNDFFNSFEENFPKGTESLEQYKTHFNNLAEDAQSMSEELNMQLRASTQYIQNFVQDNQSVFNSLGKLDILLQALEKYTKVQAECYKDLKEEIKNLKDTQLKIQSEYNSHDKDFLMAVRDMISVIKNIKN